MRCLRGDPAAAAERLRERARALARAAAGGLHLRAIRAGGDRSPGRSAAGDSFEDRIDADLELGRHSQLVAELERLVREHPLRERLRGQLMLAAVPRGPPSGRTGVLSDRPAER